MHWGCLPAEMLAKLKAAYPESSDVEGFAVLKEAEQAKVHRAWDADEIPEEDKGPGEAVADVNPKKAPVKRAKKENGEPPKKRARKAKVGTGLVVVGTCTDVRKCSRRTKMRTSWKRRRRKRSPRSVRLRRRRPKRRRRHPQRSVLRRKRTTASLARTSEMTLLPSTRTKTRMRPMTLKSRVKSAR